MSTSPRTYRIYCYDHRNKIVSAEWLDATDDDAAVIEAQEKGFGSQCEIWEGQRIVAKLAEERREA